MQSALGMTDPIHEWARVAINAGWKVERTTQCHWKFTPPAGRILFTGGTPSDWRSRVQFRADLKRQGLRLK